MGEDVATPQPLVVCVMVTGKTPARLPLARRALRCWQAQTYLADRRRLLIVNDGAERLFSGDEPPGVTEICAKAGTSLGGLRNIGQDSAIHLRPDWYMQWDDDDLSHPTRIAWQVANTRDQALASVFRYEVHRDTTTGECFVCCGDVSRVGGFAGTMLYRPRSDIVFRDLGRHEDTEFLLSYARLWRGALQRLDNPPLLYVRTYHGTNTWDQAHVMRRRRGSRELTTQEAADVEAFWRANPV